MGKADRKLYMKFLMLHRMNSRVLGRKEPKMQWRQETKQQLLIPVLVSIRAHVL